MITAFIALGSNLQQPAQQLLAAVTAIARLPQSQIERVSNVYRSPAVGPGVQPDYLNAVLSLATALAPMVLLEHLQKIEMDQGRTRTIRWEARSLDLDILLYGDQQLESDRLQIPHPRMGQRDFVLYPLLEISGPKLKLPDGTDLGTLVARCPRGDLVDTGLKFDIEFIARQGAQ